MQAKIGEFDIISGVLPRDAEFSLVGDKSTPLAKFGVKVDEKSVPGSTQREAIWRNCTCWRDVAHTASEFIKGDVIFAIGKVSVRTYTGRDGEEKTSRDLVCEFVSRMDVPPSSQSRQPAQHTEPKAAEFTAVDPDDGELPF